MDDKTNVDLFTGITARVEEVRAQLGLSRMAFCRRIGFSYARYHHITGERRSKPSADLLSAVAEHTTVNPRWLLSGEGPAYAGVGGATRETADGGALGFPAGGDTVQRDGGTLPHSGGVGPSAMDENYVLLPLYNVQGSAGSGGLVENEEVEDLLAFKRQWITNELRSNPEALALIHVQGESMVPTLNPGDVILLERNDGAQPGDGIYVIRLGEALLVKRLQFLPLGEVRVASDNPAYEAFTVHLGRHSIEGEGEHPEDLHIIGRVVWAGRRF